MGRQPRTWAMVERQAAEGHQAAAEAAREMADVEANNFQCCLQSTDNESLIRRPSCSRDNGRPKDRQGINEGIV